MSGATSENKANNALLRATSTKHKKGKELKEHHEAEKIVQPVSRPTDEFTPAAAITGAPSSGRPKGTVKSRGEGNLRKLLKNNIEDPLVMLGKIMMENYNMGDLNAAGKNAADLAQYTASKMKSVEVTNNNNTNAPITIVLPQPTPEPQMPTKIIQPPLDNSEN